MLRGIEVFRGFNLYERAASNIFLAVLTTAVRISRSRQQYKIGLMEEFINAAVSANVQAIVHRSGNMAKIDMEANNGV